jgi:hypothetical protein
MVKVAYTVGRFQPPTIGHKSLIQAVKDAAGPDGKAYVFVSSSQNPKAKNPLTSVQKLPILEHMFPKDVIFIDTAKCKKDGEPCGGALAAFYYLLNTKKHDKKDITLVVGDDHKDDFGLKSGMWNRKEEKDVYGPEDFKFLKSAKRNPDLEIKDAANMSGTKARQYVKLDRKDDFYIAVGYDSAPNKAAADAIYDIIKGGKKGGTCIMGAGKKDLETAFGADAEFNYPARKTRRAKGSSRRRTQRVRVKNTTR